MDRIENVTRRGGAYASVTAATIGASFRFVPLDERRKNFQIDLEGGLDAAKVRRELQARAEAGSSCVSGSQHGSETGPPSVFSVVFVRKVSGLKQ